jgi:hypothetical protein
MEWYGLHSSGSELRIVEGSCLHGNEPLASIKYWEILEKLRDQWFLEDLVPWS